jgi:Flp pilus assembly protein TadG
MIRRDKAKKQHEVRQGTLRRLARDESGNVMIIMAAAIIPILAIVGGATDMSRIYMAKTRLQSACDAGVLAGRRAIPGTVYTQAARDRAQNIFNFNFPDGAMTAENIVFTTQANATLEVSGNASLTLPTTIMTAFGFEDTNISVTCNADIQVPNIDIMMVLDVTGSMSRCPDGNNIGIDGCVANNSRIVNLRSAVRNFYNTLEIERVNSPRSVFRYGFVPYSQTVNASQIFTQSPVAASGQLGLDNIADTHTYQSRVANFATPQITPVLDRPSGSPTIDYETYSKVGSNISATTTPLATPTPTPMSSGDCDNYEINNTFTIDNGTNSGTVFNPSVSGNTVFVQGSTYSSAPPTTGDYSRIIYSAATSRTGWNNGNNEGNYRNCTRKRTIQAFRESNRTVFKFTNWIYRPVNYDTSQYKNNIGLRYTSAINTNTASVQVSGIYDMFNLARVPNQTGLTTSTATWNGCLEERPTVSSTSFSPVPDGAFDLDFTTAGTNANTRWRPMMSSLVFQRADQNEVTTTTSIGSIPSFCPAPMRNLAVINREQLDNILDGLQPIGQTYHDSGMIWGTRLLSRNGMFAYRNQLGPNGGQISRNIIFMTDGSMEPREFAYSSYGIESVDRRITNGDTGITLTQYHNRRFQAMCVAARNDGISIWVIAFGTALTQNLIDCADPGRSFAATDAATLNDRFKRIAEDIADLRLTQ